MRAHAIGSKQPHATIVRRGHERRFQRLATFDLAEAARHDLRVPDPAARAGEDRGDLLGPHRDVGIVDGLGRFRERAVCGEAFEGRLTRMDRKNFSVKVGRLQRTNEPVALPRAVSGSADDRDRARREKRTVAGSKIGRQVTASRCQVQG